MSIWNLAYKNVFSKPWALLLSVLLFALGIGLISFLILLNQQMKEKFDNNLAEIDMVIGAKGSPLQLILSSMYHIDNPTGNINIGEAKAFLNPKHPLIKLAVPLSLGDSHKSYRIVGTDYRFLQLYEAEIGEGKLWSEDLEVTIGADVAENTGLSIGDKFSSSHGFLDDPNLLHDDTKFKVVGILKTSNTVADQLILTNSASVWMVHEGHNHDEDEEGHTEEDHDHEGHDHQAKTENSEFDPEELLSHQDKDITSILIQFKNKTNFQALNMPRAINENTDLLAASPAIEINSLYALVGVGTDTLRMLAMLIAFVSGLSIFISLFSSLKERRYELALIRVMGGSRAKVFMLIIIEGLILAIIGCVVGLVLSHVGMEIMSSYLKDAYQYQFTGWIWLNQEWFLILVSLLLGIVAALIPAIQASRTDINTVLSKA